MKKLYAFSKYIFYNVGGAEKSMVEILKKKNIEQNEITIIGIENLKHFNSSNYAFVNSYGWRKISINLKFIFQRFFYLEYFLNKGYLKSFFKKLDKESELITYGFYAPAAALGFSGQTTIYLRSESDIGINENYYSGIKGIFKSLYIILEYPFYLSYRNDLKCSYANAKLIFNSQWMAKECKKRFSVDGTVEYPAIDFEILKKNFLSNKQAPKNGIVFIGDAEIKGLSTVLKIAKVLNEQTFYIFGRNIDTKSTEGNIVFMPWSTDSSIPFQHAKLLIVPSIWQEAYGRVSVEAQYLGIPVLVSDRGGLPETVGFNEKYIVKQYLDVNQWVKKIRENI